MLRQYALLAAHSQHNPERGCLLSVQQSRSRIKQSSTQLIHQHSLTESVLIACCCHADHSVVSYSVCVCVSVSATVSVFIAQIVLRRGEMC